MPLSDGRQSDGAATSIGADAAASLQRQEADTAFALPCGIMGARHRLVSLARDRPAHPRRQIAARLDVTGAIARLAEQQDLAEPSAARSPVHSAGQCTEKTQFSVVDVKAALLERTRGAPQDSPETENREPEVLVTSTPAQLAGDSALSTRPAQTAGQALRDSNRPQIVSPRLPSNAVTGADAAAKEPLVSKHQSVRDSGPETVLPAAVHGRALRRGQPTAGSGPPAAACKRAPPRRKRLREITLSSSDDSGSDCRSERSGSAVEHREPARRTRRKACARSGSQALPTSDVAAESDSPSDADPSSSAAAAAIAAEDDSGGSCADCEDTAAASSSKRRVAKRKWNRDDNATVADLRQRCEIPRLHLRKACRHHLFLTGTCGTKR